MPFGYVSSTALIFSTGRKKTPTKQQEADEAAKGQLAVNDEPGAGHHHDQLDEPHAEIAQRHACRHHPIGFELGSAVAVVVDGEQLPLVLLVGERLHDPDAADILLDPGIELADPAERDCQFWVIRPP